VILVAHVKRENVKDPVHGNYAKWVAAVDKNVWTLTHRWADSVLFADYTSAYDAKKSQLMLTGDRVLRTVAGSGYDAKNRWGLTEEIPLTWEAVRGAMGKAPAVEPPETILERIVRMLPDMPAPSLPAIQSAVDEAGLNVGKLLKIENRMKEKVNAASAR
jgi:hypothetical protein